MAREKAQSSQRNRGMFRKSCSALGLCGLFIFRICNENQYENQPGVFPNMVFLCDMSFSGVAYNSADNCNIMVRCFCICRVCILYHSVVVYADRCLWQREPRHRQASTAQWQRSWNRWPGSTSDTAVSHACQVSLQTHDLLPSSGMYVDRHCLIRYTRQLSIRAVNLGLT